MTTKILFDGKRAVGVEYTQKGQKKRVRRGRVPLGWLVTVQ